jgi:hypothetical protein
MTMTAITTKTSDGDAHGNSDGNCGDDVCDDGTVRMFQFPLLFLIPPTAPHPLAILLSDAIIASILTASLNDHPKMMIVAVELIAVMLMVVDESVFCSHKLNYCTLFISN